MALLGVHSRVFLNWNAPVKKCPQNNQDDARSTAAIPVALMAGA